MKIEMFFSRDWLFTIVVQIVAALDACIRWYNNARVKTSFGFRSPSRTTSAWGSLLNLSMLCVAPAPKALHDFVVANCKEDALFVGKYGLQVLRRTEAVI